MIRLLIFLRSAGRIKVRFMIFFQVPVNSYFDSGRLTLNTMYDPSKSK